MPVNLDRFPIRNRLTDEQRAEALRVADQISSWASRVLRRATSLDYLWVTNDGFPAVINGPSLVGSEFWNAHLAIEIFDYSKTIKENDYFVFFEDCVVRRSNSWTPKSDDIDELMYPPKDNLSYSEPDKGTLDSLGKRMIHGHARQQRRK
jgi:hypothetical protein